jgi:hypothetical protein
VDKGADEASQRREAVLVARERSLAGREERLKINERLAEAKMKLANDEVAKNRITLERIDEEWDLIAKRKKHLGEQEAALAARRAGHNSTNDLSSSSSSSSDSSLSD